MTGQTDWVSAIAILASGLILGLMFYYFVGRRRAASAAAKSDLDLELRDLEAKRDALIAQIRELDDVSSKLGPQEAAEERTRLELQTAQVLRAIDTRKKAANGARVSSPAVVVSRAAEDSRAPRSSATVGFLWGVGSVLALVGLGYFVMQSSKPRDEGGSVTGGGAMQNAQQQPQPQADAEIRRLEGSVAQQPDNLELRIELARAYLDRENLMGVFDQTQYVLTKAPNEPRALTYQGIVRLAMGQGPEAVEMLDKATKSAPDLLDAWVGLAWARTQQGDPKGAEAAIASAVKAHPEEKQRLEDVLTQMRSAKDRAAQQQVAEGSGELPPGHPPITPDSPRVGPATASARAATGGGGDSVRITLEGTPVQGGTLFVIARAAGVTAGPPVAVKRMMITSLPMTIELGQADSMMGQPLPAKLRVEARIDTDGDAATRNPNDPHAVQDGVDKGSSIKLALK